MKEEDKYIPDFCHRRRRQFWLRLAKIYTPDVDKEVGKQPFLWNMEKTIR